MLVTQDAKMVVSTRSVNNDKCNKYGIIANIYFFSITNYSKTKSVKTVHCYYFMVTMGQRAWFSLVLPWNCSQNAAGGSGDWLLVKHHVQDKSLKLLTRSFSSLPDSLHWSMHSTAFPWASTLREKNEIVHVYYQDRTQRLIIQYQ